MYIILYTFIVYHLIYVIYTYNYQCIYIYIYTLYTIYLIINGIFYNIYTFIVFSNICDLKLNYGKIRKR